MKYIFLNWKAGVNYDQALALAHLLKQVSPVKDRQIVALPPAVFLLPVAEILKDSAVSVGLQNISNFPNGPFTGEVTAEMVAPYINFCLIGHNERRKFFHESIETTNQKISLCVQHKITPVICVGDESQLKAITIPDGFKDIFVVFEPPANIGAKEALEIGEILKFSKIVRDLFPSTKFIYGGSVSESNSSLILSQEGIDGILPGRASLDSERLKKMLFS